MWKKHITNSPQTCQIPSQQQQKSWTLQQGSTRISQRHTRLSSSAVHSDQRQRDTIPQAYSCQTKPSTFHIYVDKLWVASQSHRVSNCFNIFQFGSRDFSHSQEINIKCSQHNPPALTGVSLRRKWDLQISHLSQNRWLIASRKKPLWDCACRKVVKCNFYNFHSIRNQHWKTFALPIE